MGGDLADVRLWAGELERLHGGSCTPDPEAWLFPLGDGAIRIGVRDSRHYGRWVKSLREHVEVNADRSSGFTLDEVEKDSPP